MLPPVCSTDFFSTSRACPLLPLRPCRQLGHLFPLALPFFSPFFVRAHFFAHHCPAHQSFSLKFAVRILHIFRYSLSSNKPLFQATSVNGYHYCFGGGQFYYWEGGGDEIAPQHKFTVSRFPVFFLNVFQIIIRETTYCPLKLCKKLRTSPATRSRKLRRYVMFFDL